MPTVARGRPLATVDDLTLPLAEQVCLALVATGAGHGWAIVRELSADGEIGRIWHLSRALTYRAVDQLTAKGLLRRDEPENRRTRDRVALATTDLGLAMTRAWLDSPVAHLRDVRTELLVKVALRRRAGLDPQLLLRAQARRLRGADRHARAALPRPTTTSSTCGGGRWPGPCGASSISPSTTTVRPHPGAPSCASPPVTSCEPPSPRSATGR